MRRPTLQEHADPMPANPPAAVHRWARRVHGLAHRTIPRLRAGAFRLFLGVDMRAAGVRLKLRGIEGLRIGRDFRVGDHCWIEAVTSYRGLSYAARLRIGDGVSVSDFTHISCAGHIDIGDGCLLGSKIYIGDHSHGPTRALSDAELVTPPGARPLAHIEPIEIGANCWVGDGAVILGGTRLAPGCIVAANSVVRLQCDRAALIAGLPARVVRYLQAGHGDAPDPS
jgi:acetyltransferase-like isoleucine patch superfamily enzyme